MYSSIFVCLQLRWYSRHLRNMTENTLRLVSFMFVTTGCSWAQTRYCDLNMQIFALFDLFSRCYLWSNLLDYTQTFNILLITHLSIEGATSETGIW
jgi:hypothetical protein